MINSKYKPIGYALLSIVSYYGFKQVEKVQDANQAGFISAYGVDIIGMGFTYGIFRIARLPPKISLGLILALGTGFELFTEVGHRLGQIDWGGDPIDVLFYGGTTGLLILVDTLYERMFDETSS